MGNCSELTFPVYHQGAPHSITVLYGYQALSVNAFFMQLTWKGIQKFTQFLYIFSFQNFTDFEFTDLGQIKNINFVEKLVLRGVKMPIFLINTQEVSKMTKYWKVIPVGCISGRQLPATGHSRFYYLLFATVNLASVHAKPMQLNIL